MSGASRPERTTRLSAPCAKGRRGLRQVAGAEPETRSVRLPDQDRTCCPSGPRTRSRQRQARRRLHLRRRQGRRHQQQPGGPARASSRTYNATIHVFACNTSILSRWAARSTPSSRSASWRRSRCHATRHPLLRGPGLLAPRRDGQRASIRLATARSQAPRCAASAGVSRFPKSGTYRHVRTGRDERPQLERFLAVLESHKSSLQKKKQPPTSRRNFRRFGPSRRRCASSSSEVDVYVNVK